MRPLRLTVGLSLMALMALTAVSLAQDELFDAPVRNPGQTQLCNPCIDPPVRYPRSDSLGGTTVISADDMRRLGVRSVSDMINQRRAAILGAAPTDCPRTDVSAAQTFRLDGSTRNWFGSESLAVSLLTDAVYSDGVILRWTGDAFRPDLVDEFSVSVRRIGVGPATAVTRPVVAEQVGNGWQLLTQVRFSGPGCWQISGHFLGQGLTFVAESLDPPIR